MEGFSHVWIGISVDMSHTRFRFHATTLREGGIMGCAFGHARPGHVVDSSERSTANILADAVSGLEDASMDVRNSNAPG